MDSPRLITVSGVTAAGKTTVGRALAERFPRAVHIDGDAIQGFVVTGAEPMSARPAPAAVRQLALRYAASLRVAELYLTDGFTAVVTDNIYGFGLGLFARALEGVGLTTCFVMLTPGRAAILDRYAKRPGGGYSETLTPDDLLRAVDETPRIGLWIDNSDLAPEEVVVRIENDLDGAFVSPAAMSAAGRSQPMH